MENGAILYTILGISGLYAGSFFNVLIWRIPRGESVVWPPSYCPRCGKKIKPYDNIPIISYIVLGGKCRCCKARISPVYPAVEFLTAAMLISVWAFVGMNSVSPWYDLIFPAVRIASLLMLIPMTVIDMRHYIIPDRFTLTFLALGLCLSFIPNGPLSPIGSLLGALAGATPLFLLGLTGKYLFKKSNAMGMGDIKLMAALGALWSIEVALLGILFGAVLASIAGGILILFKKLNDDHRIPFGPFLGAGALIAIFIGENLLLWYLGLFH